jgi:hypothetical protein
LHQPVQWHKPRRVYRVSGFLSNRQNWVPPPLHPQESVAPPPLESKGGDTLARGGGGGGPSSDEGKDTMALSVYTIVPLPQKPHTYICPKKTSRQQ